MTLSMGLDGLPDGFGLVALAVVLVVLAAMSLSRWVALQPKLVPARSRKRDGTGFLPRS